MSHDISAIKSTAWLAGVFEAKGNIYGHRTRGVEVTIATDVLEVVEMVKDVFEHGYISVSQPKKKTLSGDSVKPSYRFRIRKKGDVIAFRETVWPFLSEHKKRQFTDQLDKANGVEQ